MDLLKDNTKHLMEREEQYSTLGTMYLDLASVSKRDLLQFILENSSDEVMTSSVTIYFAV